LKRIPWEGAGELRARASAVLEEHDLSRVRTPLELTERIAQITGKPIVIEKLDDAALVRTTAMWVEYEEYSKVVLRSGDRTYYQLRGLHHEFGHMLFGHPGCEGLLLDEGIQRIAGVGMVRGRVLIAENDLSPLSSNNVHEAEAEALGALLTRLLLRPTYLDDERVFG